MKITKRQLKRIIREGNSKDEWNKRWSDPDIEVTEPWDADFYDDIMTDYKNYSIESLHKELTDLSTDAKGLPGWKRNGYERLWEVIRDLLHMREEEAGLPPSNVQFSGHAQRKRTIHDSPYLEGRNRMRLTKRQLKRIVKEEYSRIILEMGSSYGSPAVVRWISDNMTFREMYDSALDILEDLLMDQGSVLIPKEDSQNLYEFVRDLMEDGDEDMEIFEPLIRRDDAGENDRWSMQ